MLADVVEQELLGLVVGFTHQVDHAFLIDVQELAKAGAQDISRLPGEGDEVSEGRRHSKPILAGLQEEGKEIGELQGARRRRKIACFDYYSYNITDSKGTIISSADKPPCWPMSGFSFSAHHR